MYTCKTILIKRCDFIFTFNIYTRFSGGHHHKFWHFCSSFCLVFWKWFNQSETFILNTKKKKLNFFPWKHRYIKSKSPTIKQLEEFFRLRWWKLWCYVVRSLYFKTNIIIHSGVKIQHDGRPLMNIRGICSLIYS